MLEARLSRFPYLFFVFCLASLICAAVKFPEYPVRAATEYALKAENAGVSIGALPVEDLKDQKTYFGTELTSKGIIPVFVVIHNGTSGESFLFDRAKTVYGPVDSTMATPTVRSKPGEAIEIASFIAYSPIGIFVGIKMISKASEVQQNLITKELQSKTISPGGSVHGFLYIPVPKKGPRSKMHLRVTFNKPASDETSAMDLFF